MKHQLEIQASVVRQLRDHALAHYPEEACGFIFGKKGPVPQATEFVPVANAAREDRQRRYEIAPLDYLKAERKALQSGQELLGIFHTHPNHPAVASRQDRLAAVEGLSYLILSVYSSGPQELLSWRLAPDGTMVEEELALVHPISLNQIA